MSISCLDILSLKIISYSVNQMVYDVSFTAESNKLIVESLLDYIYYHYSNMSVGVVGYDFDYDLGSRLCRGD